MPVPTKNVIRLWEASPLRLNLPKEEGHERAFSDVSIMPEAQPVIFCLRLRPRCALTFGDRGPSLKFAKASIPFSVSQTSSWPKRVFSFVFAPKEINRDRYDVYIKGGAKAIPQKHEIGALKRKNHNPPIAFWPVAPTVGL
jgi:hypothetical protein